MFVDEITIQARAGSGGNGVIRWRREKHQPKGGPAGGNGGRGGHVYVRAVKDLGLLSKYTGAKEFRAKDGQAGGNREKYGKDGEDLYINMPVGSTVTDMKSGRVFDLKIVGDEYKILIGGKGGLGNVHFKSSTNRAPEKHTEGTAGEASSFHIELKLVVDIGLVGLPNAGKSTLLNALTGAHSRVGAYAFTTLEPHLGECLGRIIADIPGLIEGASEGKGLGHKFLKHIERTRMIVHVLSLASSDVMGDYAKIRGELDKFSHALTEKSEWVVLTKADCVSEQHTEETMQAFLGLKKRVFVTSSVTGEGISSLREAVQELV